jgi:hypothetical protein
LCYYLIRKGDDFIDRFSSEFAAVSLFCKRKNIPFNFIFRGSKYAAYRIKPDDCNVIRLDNEYFVLPNITHLMIRRFLIHYRKGDVDTETLFNL